MVRPRLDSPPPGSAELNEEFWFRVCGTPNPTTRERFLYLTIEEFGRLGPGRFSHVEVVQKLGYTMAMINHYFGSRGGLISEAAAVVYDTYVEAVRRGIVEANPTPTDRLRGWMNAQIQFAFERPGWAVVHNYPDLVLEDPVEFESEYRARMTQGFEVNLGRLAQLILDIKSGTVTRPEVTPENFDRSGYMANHELVELTASVAMSTLGAGVWGAGSHAPSRATKEAVALRDHVIEKHLETVIRAITSSTVGA
jgi:AcrR family transcriptional regulator